MAMSCVYEEIDKEAIVRREWRLDRMTRDLRMSISSTGFLVLILRTEFRREREAVCLPFRGT